MFKQPLRYSEDIDLVQIQAEPIGATVDAVREALSWLGRCQREQAGHSMHLVFKFTPEVDSQATHKLKIEINTREHTNLLGIKPYPFAFENDWYRENAPTSLTRAASGGRGRQNKTDAAKFFNVHRSIDARTGARYSDGQRKRWFEFPMHNRFHISTIVV